MKIALRDKPFTKEALIHTLKQMNGRKSLGPDCFHACFLQKYRVVLGQKVIDMTLDILNNVNNVKDVSAINDTLISLFLKLNLRFILKTLE